MAATCSVCGTKLGFGRRIAGKTLCEPHEAEQQEREAAEEAAQVAARDHYALVASNVVTDPTAVERLPAIAVTGGMSDSDRAQANVAAVTAFLRAAIDDGYLTPDEEKAAARAATALGLTEAQMLDAIREFVPPASYRMLIAKINAGWLPTIHDPTIVLKPKEVAHAQVAAELMKEVVHRETRGRTSGFSVPLVAGVRYRVGAFSGRSVVTGTSIEVADTGTLCVTSQRAVFKGMRRSVESLYSKVIGLNVFDDGIQIHVSNRQNATLFRVHDGHLVAALINAAMHPEGVGP